VIVEIMFRYQGIGWLLVNAAATMLLACSLVSVSVVLITQPWLERGH